MQSGPILDENGDPILTKREPNGDQNGKPNGNPKSVFKKKVKTGELLEI